MTMDHPFFSFGLSEGVLVALSRKGFTAPTPIQSLALPRLLADSGHLIVKARTGTGKTAAFGLPLVERLTESGHDPRALILTPTRELALQVSREIASFVPGAFPRITAVYGGASIRNQILDLKRGTEIVVGTPGRVMDLMDRRVLNLAAVDWFILDEADEMLDMGFIEDVEKILGGVKKDRRVALFSATMPEPILRIVREYIGETEILEDAGAEDEKPLVDQYYLILKREDRFEALRRLIDRADDFYGLVFCATKAETDEVARRLVEGGYAAEAIHGDLSQEVRERTLRRFRARRALQDGRASVLVATDVAARGLDIERLTHVINWDFPHDKEAYVHRIGRTGRAGRRGTAISLVLPSERGKVNHLSRGIERTLGSKIAWTQVPSVKSVLKTRVNRILASILETEQINPPETPPLEAPDPVPPEAAVLGESALSPGSAPPGGGILPEEVPPAASPPGDLPGEDRQSVENPPEEDLPPAAGPRGDAPGLVSPALSRLARQLTEKLGPQGALEALITKMYGELLDPARYGPVTEFSEFPKDEKGPHHKGRTAGRPRAGGSFWQTGGGRQRFGGSRTRAGEIRTGEKLSRVYVGVGRQHGASARDVADLLMRAGGVPGRLVDAIEVKDYCAFATLPEEAARRAYAFSRKTPGNPAIKPASELRE
jgi:ATP-dependent RNA helicase DeaD